MMRVTSSVYAAVARAHTAAQDSYLIALDSYQMIAPSIKRLGSYLNSYQLIDGAIITYPNTEQLSADSAVLSTLYRVSYPRRYSTVAIRVSTWGSYCV